MESELCGNFTPNYKHSKKSILVEQVRAIKSSEAQKLVLTRTTHRRTDANLYPSKRQLTKGSEPSFDLKGGA